MAFPTIPTAAGSRILGVNQANTTATRTSANLSGLTKNVNDLLICIVYAYQTTAASGSAFSGWTAGWTEFIDQSAGGATGLSIGAAYKWSTGSETGTVSATQAATITGNASIVLLSIDGAHRTTPPEASAIANGTAAAADPAALDPAGWAAEDTLWIAVSGNGETSATGTWTGSGGATPTAPTNYSGSFGTATADGSLVGEVDGAVAFRQLNASSENVGTWGSNDLSNAKNSALLIAVRPKFVIGITAAAETDAAQALVGTLGPSDTYGRAVFADIPKSWWRLPDTGATAVDYMSFANATFGASGLTKGTTGIVANSDNLATASAGTQEIASTAVGGGAGFTNGVGFTVEAWCRSTAANNTTKQSVVEKDTGNDTAEQYGMNLTAASKFEFFIRDSVGYKVITTTTPTWSPNTTYHMVLRWNGTTLHGFVNGVSVGTPITVARPDVARDVAQLWFGTERSGSNTPLFPFIGKIDEPAYYDTALSDARILAHFNAGVQTYTLTAATETDAAQTLTKSKRRTLTVATETDAAQALTKSKQKIITTATSTNTAQVLTFTQQGATIHVVPSSLDFYWTAP